jgi:hypothetical protein
VAIFRVPVTMAWNGAGSPGVNTFSVRTVGPTQTDDNNQLDAALAALHDFYAAFAVNFGLSCKTTMGDGIVEVTDIAAPRAVERPNPLPIDGVAGGISPVLQIVVGWRTALAKRAGMGRTFLGPWHAGIDDEGTGLPNQGTVDSIRAAADALVAASGIDNLWGLGVLSHAGNVGQIHRDIIGASVKRKFAVLRSRRD